MSHMCTVSRVLSDIEVECTVSGEGHWEDYGVINSPRWLEIDEVEIDWPVTANGVNYADEESLEAAHPGMVAAIVEYATESGDWSE